MAMGPIPWRDVVDYAERLGMSAAMVDFFGVVIRVLDETYLSDMRRDAERARD